MDALMLSFSALLVTGHGLLNGTRSCPLCHQMQRHKHEPGERQIPAGWSSASSGALARAVHIGMCKGNETANQRLFITRQGSLELHLCTVNTQSLICSTDPRFNAKYISHIRYSSALQGSNFHFTQQNHIGKKCLETQVMFEQLHLSNKKFYRLLAEDVRKRM